MWAVQPPVAQQLPAAKPTMEQRGGVVLPTLSTSMQPPKAHTQANTKWYSSSFLSGAGAFLAVDFSLGSTPSRILQMVMTCNKVQACGTCDVVRQTCLVVTNRRTVDPNR